MPGLTEPLWLLLLLPIIPLVRWLHRWHAPLAAIPVSALFLWRGAAQSGVGGTTERPPDRAWWRRALIAALLLVALAEPWLQSTERVLTVWIDDSLSMRTVESGRSRLSTALAELASTVEEVDYDTVLLRSLTNPATQLSLVAPNALAEDRWPTDRLSTLNLPPPALLSSSSAHWLLTDGATSQIHDWAQASPLSHIIQVGALSDNVAITHLAARRQPHVDAGVDVLVAVTNHGSTNAQRELLLSSGSEQKFTGPLSIDAGETKLLSVAVDDLQRSLNARIVPGDSLAVDDQLTLETDIFSPVAVRIDPSCPTPLRHALRAHPGLEFAATTDDPGLDVLCTAAASTSTTLSFRTGRTTALASPPAWLPAAGDLQTLNLRPAWLAASAWPDVTAENAETLMLAGSVPLIIKNRTGVESIIDVGNHEFSQQPEFAAFVAGLVDHALGRPILDPVVTVAADAQTSDIAPKIVDRSATDTAGQSASRWSLRDLIIALALFVLCIDVALIVRSRRALTHA